MRTIRIYDRTRVQALTLIALWIFGVGLLAFA